MEQRINESAKAGAREELQAALQDALGCTNTKLSRLLNNSATPSIEELIAASQVLAVPLDDLVQLTPEPATADAA